MLCIHSPDYVFMVLVSILMSLTHNYFSECHPNLLPMLPAFLSSNSSEFYLFCSLVMLIFLIICSVVYQKDY